VGSWRQAHLDDLLDGMTPMEFILRFTLTNPDLNTTIVGTINSAHLQTNLDILQQGPLPPDTSTRRPRTVWLPPAQRQERVWDDDDRAYIGCSAHLLDPRWLASRTGHGLMVSPAAGIKMALGLVSVST
jgi:hypothetical protein